jgi:hypothetical protein
MTPGARLRPAQAGRMPGTVMGGEHRLPPSRLQPAGQRRKADGDVRAPNSCISTRIAAGPGVCWRPLLLELTPGAWLRPAQAGRVPGTVMGGEHRWPSWRQWASGQRRKADGDVRAPNSCISTRYGRVPGTLTVGEHRLLPSRLQPAGQRRQADGDVRAPSSFISTRQERVPHTAIGGEHGLPQSRLRPAGQCREADGDVRAPNSFISTELRTPTSAP